MDLGRSRCVARRRLGRWAPAEGSVDLKHRKGAGAEVQTRPPAGQGVVNDELDRLLAALPVGREVPVHAPGLMWLYASGAAGPGLAAFVERLLARSRTVRGQLLQVRQRPRWILRRAGA